jgi:hypothetical protein
LNLGWDPPAKNGAALAPAVDLQASDAMDHLGMQHHANAKRLVAQLEEMQFRELQLGGLREAEKAPP